MRICQRTKCDQEIVGRKASAIYCSVRCNNIALTENRSAAKWADIDPDRPCAFCEKPLTGKRPQAKFCDRICKSKDSTRRREADGRGVLRAHARRAFTRALVDHRELKRMYNRQGGRCYYCSRKRKLQLDHVIPVKQGGAHVLGNFVLACQPCNGSKGAKFLSVWRYQRLGMVGR